MPEEQSRNVLDHWRQAWQEDTIQIQPDADGNTYRASDLISQHRLDVAGIQTPFSATQIDDVLRRVSLLGYCLCVEVRDDEAVQAPEDPRLRTPPGEHLETRTQTQRQTKGRRKTR